MTTAREDTTRLADLLRREHHARGEFLVALAAFDREQRWRELGYSGLFSFLTRELRLSNGAAQNRKTAAELIQRFPRVEAALRNGDLCLSSVNEVAKVITPENAGDLLPRFYGKSARDAAFLSASIRPIVDPPERFVVTPVRGRAAPATESPAGRGLELQTCEVPLPVGTDRSALQTCEVPAARVAAATRPPAPSPAARPTIKPLDGERARMNITVSRRLLEKLAAARDALSHSHPGASEDAILELGLDLIIERHRKRRGIGAKPRNGVARPGSAVAKPGTAHVGSAPPAPKRSRHVPAAVWRAVWERDRGCCAWPLENGGVCGSTYQLELDHVNGWALGAETTIDGTRLLCRPHQDVHARRLYGDAHMNAYTRPKGGSCSEPVAVYGRRDADRGGRVRAPSRHAVLTASVPARATISRPDSRPTARVLSTGRSDSPPAAARPQRPNAAFSSASFSSRVPIEIRMQPSSPL